ncbi:tRNA cyclic N6-threonylcarbamoyladenosine(37) synthase TcdA [Marinagarivorans algicola]|uniref:tRNA cyclic N6-threonylcarbamoyladenosine(37) synthase TcdA n=1 Tax=Marinagarivorans algicola TaxID=1513270 RepID=UPI0006B9B2C8|nr:tRNA cyclic N6-threonylcarbamoyladenosine(37) synthase TcdA [Marinagarivorans algicola]
MDNLPPLSTAYQQRFGGVARLYGQEALTQLANAHMTIVGLGGVGSWVAEALARSGVGTLTLIELDDICITNSNRQLHALASTLGQQKNAVLCARLKDINPEITVHSHEDFLTPKNLNQLITCEHHIIIDAIDSANVKAALAAHCIYRKQRLIMTGSSGGKIDPAQIAVNDLGRTISDPLLAKVRNMLHRHYNFERNTKRKFRVDAVYSREQMRYPQQDGSVCQNKKGMSEGVKLDCAGGFGSATMLTGSFGFMAASQAITRYLQDCHAAKHSPSGQ